MESEKVKEIKKALKDHSIEKLKYQDGIKIKEIGFTDVLTLINELEIENEMLKTSEFESCQELDNAFGQIHSLEEHIAEWEKENRILTKDIVFSNDKVDIFGKPVILTIGGVALGEAYNKIINWEQEQQRIKELEEYIKGNEQDSKAFVNAWHKDLETELKLFAERLKEELGNRFNYIDSLIKSKIDEILKEFI